MSEEPPFSQPSLEETLQTQAAFESAPGSMLVDHEVTLGLKNCYEFEDGERVLQYAIQWQEDLPGSVQIVAKPDSKVMTLGYSGRTHLPQFEGRGLIARSARRLCQYAFENEGAEAIRLNIKNDNTPSIRVAERLGATLVQDNGNMQRWMIGRDSFLASLYAGQASESVHEGKI